MIRNQKALSMAVFAVLALGALTAQGASAATEHEFHSDGEWTVGTGASTNNWEMAVGSAGTVKCTKVEFEDESVGTEVKAGTYKSDTLTVSARFTGCTFGGAAATVNTEHCAFVLDSETTEGNPTGGEHANVELECTESNRITITTTLCTLTVGPQLVKHSIQYQADEAGEGKSVNGIVAAHGINIGNLNDKAGCSLVPKGAVGKLAGAGTTTCYKDEGSWLTGTEKTTPTEKTVEGPKTECSVP